MDIIGLLPQVGGLLWTVAAFILALSVIVTIHEYGHYIVGRWSGIHADVFSLGFGPVLYKRTDKRGTQWQIAALPFGGYVKFAGDANAASGKDVDAMEAAGTDAAALRRTMHGAPLWARAATVAAGPVFNFVFSILVFAVILLTAGVARDPLTVGELRPLPAEMNQLQTGDTVLEIAGEPVPSIEDEAYSAFLQNLPKTEVLDYRVVRDGTEMDVQGPYIFPPLIVALSPRSAAVAADLEVGDVIVGVDGTPIVAFDQLKIVVEASDGAPVALRVWRDGEVLDKTLTAKRIDEPHPDGGFVTYWRIGIQGGMAFELGTEARGVGEAFSGAVGQTWQIITGSLSGLGHMITGAISTCNLSGPIGIAQTSGTLASQGAESFVWFIAVLSTAVGLLNLFPIPALDGGHLVFYAYEAVMKRPPSDGALRILMGIGLTLVLTLMIFALGNDVFCP
ncbi:RIP metalloprotease RseP [Pseudosulfitobacter koreensis]|uniref:Zinc metalloprotease n=1 Tax=Pseudosulfitobacter koreensis TaxID=2968472 RepID=A0ABT1Z2E7_9RHOB|nr:RIP metalloprotease RseP [Pseudosulfitobacter koreense]MCR8827293.1 RIP metalloprotease RseP [Pseudosulfitobacter koreense]